MISTRAGVLQNNRGRSQHRSFSTDESFKNEDLRNVLTSEESRGLAFDHFDVIQDLAPSLFLAKLWARRA